MLIRELIQNISSSLESIYDKHEATKISELLIMNNLYISHRFELYQRLNETIDDAIYKKIRKKWKRLLKAEPIQYVIHKTWFFDMEFYVNHDVLIPRPETEEMCRQIIIDLSNIKHSNLIDIGTGSGCIAISIKKHFRRWNVFATDVSDKALRIAKCNAKKNQVSIFFFQDDLFKSALYNTNFIFDVIVSNPPYIPEHEKATMHKNVINFEPPSALFVPSDNPLLFYKAIVYFANKKLTQNGVVYVEIHEHFSQEVIDLFKQHQYQTMLFNDIHNKPRFVKAVKV